MRGEADPTHRIDEEVARGAGVRQLARRRLGLGARRCRSSSRGSAYVEADGSLVDFFFLFHRTVRFSTIVTFLFFAGVRVFNELLNLLYASLVHP